MQHYAAGSSLYEDTSYFVRASEAFSIDETGDHTAVSCGSGFLGLDESLDRQLKGSGLTPLSELPTGESVISHDLGHQPLDFELDDNGQLLHDMLQQQHHQHQHQQAPSPTQQQSAAAASWEESIHVLQEMLLLQQHQALQCPDDHQSPTFTSIFSNPAALPPERINSSGFSGTKFPGESELLSLLQLPRCAASVPGAASSTPEAVRKQVPSFGMPSGYNVSGTGDSIYHNPPTYDPHVFQQPPSAPYPVSLKHLLHNLPSTHTNSTSSTLVHHLDVEDKEPPLNDEGRQFASSLFDFKRDSALPKGEPRGINHFATERQRREYLNEKYQTLRGLVPNPTKADRASIVQDAIEYVKELKRTVQELQLLVQEKRRGEGVKRRKGMLETGNGANQGVATDMESSSQYEMTGGGSSKGEGMSMQQQQQLRSSWLQRSSQHGTKVDVRIVDDEVNIKVTLKKRRNSLLEVVGVLRELRLDLLHANGATIGDHHIFMLNTKIMEGSSTFAGHVAARLIEAVDRHFCNNYAAAYN